MKAATNSRLNNAFFHIVKINLFIFYLFIINVLLK